jgi:hypothetical protein
MTGNGRVHPLPIADVVPASTPDFFNKIRQLLTLNAKTINVLLGP